MCVPLPCFQAHHGSGPWSRTLINAGTRLVNLKQWNSNYKHCHQVSLVCFCCYWVLVVEKMQNITLFWQTTALAEEGISFSNLFAWFSQPFFFLVNGWRMSGNEFSSSMACVPWKLCCSFCLFSSRTWTNLQPFFLHPSPLDATSGRNVCCPVLLIVWRESFPSSSEQQWISKLRLLWRFPPTFLNLAIALFGCFLPGPKQSVWMVRGGKHRFVGQESSTSGLGKFPKHCSTQCL